MADAKKLGGASRLVRIDPSLECEPVALRRDTPAISNDGTGSPRSALQKSAGHSRSCRNAAEPDVVDPSSGFGDRSEQSVPAFGSQCRFCAGRMNDALDDLKAWRGPAKVRTLETFIPAEHFTFSTMSQFERGNDDTSDGNAQEISDFNPRLCLHGPRKTACDCAKRRRKRTERKTQFFAKSQIGG